MVVKLQHELNSQFREVTVHGEIFTLSPQAIFEQEFPGHQAPVVQRVDSVIHWLSCYSVDEI